MMRPVFPSTTERTPTSRPVSRSWTRHRERSASLMRERPTRGRTSRRRTGLRSNGRRRVSRSPRVAWPMRYTSSWVGNSMLSNWPRVPTSRRSNKSGTGGLTRSQCLAGEKLVKKDSLVKDYLLARCPGRPEPDCPVPGFLVPGDSVADCPVWLPGKTSPGCPMRFNWPDKPGENLLPSKKLSFITPYCVVCAGEPGNDRLEGLSTSIPGAVTGQWIGCLRSVRRQHGARVDLWEIHRAPTNRVTRWTMTPSSWTGRLWLLLRALFAPRMSRKTTRTGPARWTRCTWLVVTTQLRGNRLT